MNNDDLNRLVKKFFEDDVSSAYRIGSTAVGQGTTSGDIDIVIIVSSQKLDEFTLAAERLRKLAYFIYDATLDLNVRSQSEILENGCEYTRLAGVKILGEDIQYLIPLPKKEAYERKLIKNVRKSLLSPVDLAKQRDNSETVCLSSRQYRNIVSNVCRLSVFKELSIYTSQRSEAVEIFRSSIEPEFVLYQRYFEIVTKMKSGPDFQVQADRGLFDLIDRVMFNDKD